MKNILCFGDSNTHGANPRGGRWPIGVRWTSVLDSLLGDDYRVIEEGCSARTSLFTDDLEDADVGKFSLPVCLTSHRPLDMVIIMLGTNDMKHRFNLLPVDIAVASMKLGAMARDSGCWADPDNKKIVIVSPIEIGEGIENSINTGFSPDAVEISKQLAGYYEKFAKGAGFLFFNAAKVAKPSKLDMLHMEKEDHRKLAEALCKFIKENI